MSTERVERSARGLAALGLKRGDVMAIFSENCRRAVLLQNTPLSASARAWSAPIPTPRSMSCCICLNTPARRCWSARIRSRSTRFSRCRVTPRIARVIYIDGADSGTMRAAVAPLCRSWNEPANRQARTRYARQSMPAIRLTSRSIATPRAQPGGRKARCCRMRFLLDNAYRLMGRARCTAARANISPTSRPPGPPSSSSASRLRCSRRWWCISPKSRKPCRAICARSVRNF